MFRSNKKYEKDLEYLSGLPLPWETLKSATFLITGGTGMIGTVLIDALFYYNDRNRSNFKVVVMGRSIANMKKRFSSYIERADFTFIQGDINLGFNIEGPVDYIFHCASNTHPTAYASDPVGTITTNVIGTNNLLKLAVEKKVKKILFLSTVEVYGENRGDVELFKEDYCGYLNCNTLRAGYPESKRAGEALCQAYIKKYGLNITIPRICRIYGPTMLAEDSKALAQFIKNAIRGEDIVLKSQGQQYFSYSHVTDAVSGLLYLLCHGENGQAYNVADEKSDIRLRDLAGLLAASAGTKVVFRCPDELESEGFSKATQALLDSSEIKKLGWNPRYTIENGVDQTIQVLKEIGF